MSTLLLHPPAQAGDRLAWLRQQLYRPGDAPNRPSGPAAAAFDLRAAAFDAWSQLEAVEISALQLDGEQLRIDYLVTYSGFYACQGLDYRDHERRRLRGKQLANGDWELPVFVPPEPPSPADEL